MSEQAPLFYDRAVKLCTRAVALDDAGGCGSADLNDAVKLYAEACEYFLAGYRFDKHAARRALILSRVRQFIARAEAIKAGSVSLRSRSAPASARANSDRNSVRQRASTCGSSTDADLRFDDVVGLTQAKQALINAVILPQRQPHLFAGARKPHSGILLYGPPGTGKTMLAKALAAEANCTFLSVSSSDVMSKWQGDSGPAQSVRCLKKPGRGHLCNFHRRGGLSWKAARQRGKGKPAASQDRIVAANGRPRERQQCQRNSGDRRVEYALGTGCSPATPISAADIHPAPRAARARSDSAACHGGHSHSLRDRDFQRVASATEGFSSSDMSILAREALMGPVRRCLRSTHFRRVKRRAEGSAATASARTIRAIEPCGQWDRGAQKMNIWSPSFDPMWLQAPPVTSADLESAVRTTKSSVGADDLAQCAAFTERFGSRVTASARASSSAGAAAQQVPAAPSGGIVGFFKSMFGWGGDPEQLPVAPTAPPSATAGYRPRVPLRREEEAVQERVAMIG